MTNPPPAGPNQASPLTRVDRARQMRLGAYIMLVCGGLVTLLFGGCTGIFLIAMLADAFRPGFGGEAVGFAIIPLIFGGLPMAAGLFLLYQGWKTLRDARRLGARDPADTFD